MSPSFLLRPFLKLVFLTFIYLLCEGRHGPSLHLQSGRVGEEEMTSHFSSSPPKGTVIRELALPLPSSRTQKRRPCTSPRLHNRAEPLGRGTGELARGRGNKRTNPTPHLPCGSMGKKKVLSPHSMPSAAGKRTGPRTMRVGEPALPLTSCST